MYKSNETLLDNINIDTNGDVVNKNSEKRFRRSRIRNIGKENSDVISGVQLQ